MIKILERRLKKLHKAQKKSLSMNSNNSGWQRKNYQKRLNAIADIEIRIRNLISIERKEKK